MEKKNTVYFGVKSLGQNWSMLSRSSYGKEWLVYTSKTNFFCIAWEKARSTDLYTYGRVNNQNVIFWMNYLFKLIDKKWLTIKTHTAWSRENTWVTAVCHCRELASVKTVIYSAVGPQNEQHMLKGGEWGHLSYFLTSLSIAIKPSGTCTPSCLNRHYKFSLWKRSVINCT